MSGPASRWRTSTDIVQAQAIHQKVALVGRILRLQRWHLLQLCILVKVMRSSATAAITHAYAQATHKEKESFVREKQT